MKYFILIFAFCIFSNTLFAQISLFKDINLIEEGSNPANYTEINGTVFFSIRTIDGYRLWKTDGTENGTVQVSPQNISINSSFNSTIPNFYVFNNELYYFAIDNLFQNSALWKTDGVNTSLVKDSQSIGQLYFINNSIYFIDFQGVKKIENNTNLLVKAIPNGYSLSNQPPIFFNNSLIFILSFYNDTTQQQGIQIWKSDGKTANTVPFKTIENAFFYSPYSNNYQKQTLSVNNNGFFVISSYTPQYSTKTDLWITDGTQAGTTLLKTVSTLQGVYNDNVINLQAYNNKLLFCTEQKNLWMSDGTTSGTQIAKTFDYIYHSYYDNFFGFLNNKFYFTANLNNDNELWQSDGTSAGTILLKDINPTKGSYPNYFATINNRLFFEANINEVWQSDGTEAGTTFVQNIAKPATMNTNSSISPEFIYTSTNKLIFTNYDVQTDFEPWISDGTLQNAQMLKNINTTSKGSLVSTKKVKIGNTWYFVGTDYRGDELWKTDGTPQGTTIVKDINVGAKGVFIQEMVVVGNQIFFAGRLTDESKTRLWKSDGTEVGTVEITLNSGNISNINPTSFVATNDKLFFMGLSASLGTTIWVSDGTDAGTHTLTSTNIYSGTPSNITTANGLLFFNSNGLWVSDGTETNTVSVFGNNHINVPLNPICLLEFHNKIYFYSNFINSSNIYGQALYVSDGTRNGTKIIRTFNGSDEDITGSDYLLFLEKTADRLYFRAGYNRNYNNQYINLWTSDGTTNGTYKLKKIDTNFSSPTLKFAKDRNQFYFSVDGYSPMNSTGLWSSDGTTAGTNIILQKQIGHFSFFGDGISFNNKLYFSFFDERYGFELWTSNGTSVGTYLVGEVRQGDKNSFVGSFMNFDDKLLLGADDGIHGNELWQYVPQVCEGEQRLYTLQSGDWNSPNVWSCGRIPTQDDVVIIKSPHTITIPLNFQAYSNTIFTEMNAILNIQQGAFYTIKLAPN